MNPPSPLAKATGKQLVCVHVNHGLLRKDKPEQVIRVFRGEVKGVNRIVFDLTLKPAGTIE